MTRKPEHRCTSSQKVFSIFLHISLFPVPFSYQIFIKSPKILQKSLSRHPPCPHDVNEIIHVDEPEEKVDLVFMLVVV